MATATPASRRNRDAPTFEVPFIGARNKLDRDSRDYRQAKQAGGIPRALPAPRPLTTLFGLVRRGELLDLVGEVARRQVSEGGGLEHTAETGAHRHPDLTQALGRACVGEFGEAQIVNVGEGAVDDADDVGQRDLFGRTHEGVATLGAPLTAHEVGPLEVVEDAEEELEGDVLGLGDLLGLDRLPLGLRGQLGHGPHGVVDLGRDPHGSGALRVALQIQSRPDEHQGAQGVAVLRLLVQGLGPVVLRLPQGVVVAAGRLDQLGRGLAQVALLAGQRSCLLGETITQLGHATVLPLLRPLGRDEGVPGCAKLTVAMRRVLLLLVPAAALAVFTAIGPATGAAAPPAWSPPLQLPKWSGSEPSVAIDPSDPSAVYVSAP